MRILLAAALFVALTAGCGGAKKKSPQNPTNESHESAGGDKDDDDVKDANKPADSDDAPTPKSADPCEGGQ